MQRDSRHVGKFSPHQLEILTEASAQGRRRVKIQKIAQELALPREEVLQFIKDFASRPENRPAMEQARKARVAFEQQPDRSMSGLAAGAAQQDVAAADSSGASSQDEDAPASRRSRQPKRVQPRLPFADRQRLGGDFNKKRMSRSLEDTLDRIFEEDPYPSSDKIREVLELHKGAGYQRIVEWFAQKRREDERRPKNYVKPDLAASSKAKLNFGRRRPQQQKGKDPFNWELPQ